MEFLQRAKDFAIKALILGKTMISQPPALVHAMSATKNMSPPCRNCNGSRFIYNQGSMHFCWMCIDKTLHWSYYFTLTLFIILLLISVISMFKSHSGRGDLAHFLLWSYTHQLYLYLRSSIVFFLKNLKDTHAILNLPKKSWQLENGFR